MQTGLFAVLHLFFLYYLGEEGGLIVHQMPLSNEELPFSQCHQGSETKPMS